MKTYILFHAKSIRPFRPCMDGLFAAAIARMAMPDAALVPAAYGSPPELALSESDRIFLLDLTYPAPVLRGWHDAGATIQVIDHHKTAKADLADLSLTRFDSVFDMSRSGAMLAWRYFRSNQFPSILVSYVQDRDLWAKKLSSCDVVSLALSMRMRDLSVDQAVQTAIDLINDPPLCDLIGEGHEYQAIIDQAIADAVARTIVQPWPWLPEWMQQRVRRWRWRSINGHDAPFVRVRTDWERMAYSDIGHALLKAHPDAPFACVQTGGGWALRSMDDRADVSAVAKALGGGGHRNASGCRSGNPL